MNQHANQDISFIDVAAQRARLHGSIDQAIKRVLNHGQYVNGPEVVQLEAELAAYTGAEHVVSCSSGTDALLMVLLAKGVAPGDAVICPSFTFCATGEVVALRGATPVFVDVDQDTFNINTASLKEGVALARKYGLKPKAIIPVDLFGQPAEHDAIAKSPAMMGFSYSMMLHKVLAQPIVGVSLGRLVWLPEQASSRQNHSGASEMEARFSQMMRTWPQCCEASAFTVKAPTSMTMSDWE